MPSREIQTVGLAGTGVIGSGWAVRALARGLDVVASDPAPGAAERLQTAVGRAWPSARKLGIFPGADPSRLRFVDSPEEMAAIADFVQESAPENLDLKKALLNRLAAAASPNVIIATSTSGLLPSQLQAECWHPERIVVGHPFNPVYLLPLVEVVGGTRTAPASIEAAVSFYRDLGMHPLHVRNEIDGFLSDRLLEALWREILHLVNDGIATTDELDQAIIYGPGLRWSGMGTNLIYHLAGGEAGMRHMLAQFGPALKLPWTKLEAPELTEQLIDRMVEGTGKQAAGRSITELERLRDDYLIAVLRALRATGVGAGQVMAEHESRLMAALAPARWEPGVPVPAPLDFYRCRVEADWVDYNRHMTESAYLLAAGGATDVLFRYVGVDESYRDAGHSLYTVETHIKYIKEVAVDEPIQFTTQVVGVDHKRLHILHAMYHGDNGDLLSTAEQILVNVEIRSGRSAAIPEQASRALTAVAEAHRELAPPTGCLMSLL